MDAIQLELAQVTYTDKRSQRSDAVWTRRFQGLLSKPLQAAVG
jgi:hypothetical protein